VTLQPGNGLARQILASGGVLGNAPLFPAGVAARAVPSPFVLRGVQVNLSDGFAAAQTLRTLECGGAAVSPLNGEDKGRGPPVRGGARIFRLDDFRKAGTGGAAGAEGDDGSGGGGRVVRREKKDFYRPHPVLMAHME